MRAHPDRGFSFVELLVVIATLAVAAAVAVPMLVRARRVADLGDAETIARTQVQAVITRAASRSEAIRFSAAELVHADGVVVNPDRLTPPDGTVIADAIVFQAGTGYPTVDGVRRPVAILIADRDNRDDASALVIGSSATLHVYRLGPRGWEEQR